MSTKMDSLTKGAEKKKKKKKTGTNRATLDKNSLAWYIIPLFEKYLIEVPS